MVVCLVGFLNGKKISYLKKFLRNPFKTLKKALILYIKAFSILLIVLKDLNQKELGYDH